MNAKYKSHFNNKEAKERHKVLLLALKEINRKAYTFVNLADTFD